MGVDHTPRRPRVPPKPRLPDSRPGAQQQQQKQQQEGSGGQASNDDAPEQDPVDVFCRVRPPTDTMDTCVTVLNSTTLQICAPAGSIAGRSGVGRDQQYRFKEVFGPESTQKETFDRVAKPLVSDLLNGKNGLLFAYGVTGSGKTYTMQGLSKDGGIVYRTIDVVFNSISEYQARKYVFKPDKLNGFDVQSEADAMIDRQRFDVLKERNNNNKVPSTIFKTPRRDLSGGSHNSSSRVPDTTVIGGLDEDHVYSVFVTYFEAYNNYLYDLLEDIPPENLITKNLQTKILREDGARNMYVHGCNEVEVKTPAEALEQLSRGQKRRKVAHTRLNAESSRSHSIFTIRIVQAPLDEQGEEVIPGGVGMRVSQLSLVDLAGSERTSRTKAAGLRVKEAGSINNTLMMLRTCIEVLRDNQLHNAGRMVPYRDSKITHYFKNYFDGEGKVKMIICVNPRSSDYDETLPVMKFAELASEVQVQRSVVRGAEVAGLAPGRRRANILFREVRRNMVQEGIEKAKALEVDIRPIYTLSPAWPTLQAEMTDDAWLETTTKLHAFLQRRILAREAMRDQTRDRVPGIITRVDGMEGSALLVRQQLASLQALYEQRERQLRDCEARCLHAVSANEALAGDYDALLAAHTQLQDERVLVERQGLLDKQRLKAKLNTKLEQEREKCERDFKHKVKEHKHQMVSTQVRALHQLVTGSDSSDGGSRTPVPTPDAARTPLHPPMAKTPQSLAGDVLPTTGGGTQVVFHDVEILRQRDPLNVPLSGRRNPGGASANTPAANNGNTKHTGGNNDKKYAGGANNDNTKHSGSSGVKRGSDGTPVTPLETALVRERWKALATPSSSSSTSQTPSSYKRTKL